MEIRLSSTGFNLSSGYDYINYSEQAEAFFKQYNFKYRIVEHSEEKRVLAWDEYTGKIEVGFFDIFGSLDKVKAFTEKYKCSLTIESDGTVEIVFD